MKAVTRLSRLSYERLQITGPILCRNRGGARRLKFPVWVKYYIYKKYYLNKILFIKINEWENIIFIKLYFTSVFSHYLEGTWVVAR